MKKTDAPLLLLAALFTALALNACSSGSPKSTDEKNGTAAAKPEEIVEHGKYLVHIMGCNDCHSPKKMGANGPELIPELMLSGFPSDRPIAKFDSKMLKDGFSMFYPDLTAAAGPWGVSFAGNLTPDETGIGLWTEDQFKIALTQGKYKGMAVGRTLLPPMPWMNYKNLSDADLHAIFMYLKSIPPVKNMVPGPLPPTGM